MTSGGNPGRSTPPSSRKYARHNGHADLLRERLDGSTGE
jgi:uncharacterized protein DUF664